MSAEANVAVVKAIYEAFARDELEEALAHLRPDVDGSPRTSHVTGLHDDYSGREGIRRWARDCRTQGLKVTYTVRELCAIDESSVFAEVVVSAYRNGRPGAAALIVTVWHLEDGLVTRARTYTDPAEGRLATFGTTMARLDHQAA